jgi:hypothetical protein
LLDGGLGSEEAVDIVDDVLRGEGFAHGMHSFTNRSTSGRNHGGPGEHGVLWWSLSVGQRLCNPSV